MALPNPEVYITEAELCEWFGVSRNYMGGLRRTGKLTGWLKFGHRYAYRRDDLDRIERVVGSRYSGVA